MCLHSSLLPCKPVPMHVFLAPPRPAAVAQLMQRAAGVSLLGDYSAPLAILQRLVACKPLAVALTHLPAWLPQWQVS